MVSNPLAQTTVDSPVQGNTYDLAIVGGGIVGTALASALKESGLNIALIEAQPLAQAAARERAYALSLLSGRILQGMGVWSKIFSKISKFRRIRLSDSDYSQIVQFAPEELGTEFLGYVAEHKTLLTALHESVEQSSNVNLLCPGELIKVQSQKNWVTLTVKVDGEIQSIQTRLLVGADGAQSPIRQWAGIATQGWKYWQSCVTFVIKHQAPQNDIAFERFWHTGPMGVLPLSDNRCQIVWTHPQEQAKALQELDEKAFLEKLDHYTGGALGQLELISDRRIFPVQLMQSDSYTQPRLALIGDAAHCCHPVGGQGLNLGIRDVAALAQVLQTAHEKGEDIGDMRVLQQYERWRKLENLVILGFTDFLNRLFSNHWLPLVGIRRFGLWLLKHLSPLKLFSLQLMTGLKGKMPQLAQRG